jgi:predicted dinucleotide-binding enzyme
MRVGIIGAASMGGILGRHLARLGHHVSIANSRGPEILTVLAAEIGATPVSVVDAAKAAESSSLRSQRRLSPSALSGTSRH